MEREKLTSTATKAKFVDSIYSWLMRTLKDVGNEEYQKYFVKEGSSIMCSLPENYFRNYEIPEGTRIEMKFVTKK